MNHTQITNHFVPVPVIRKETLFSNMIRCQNTEEVDCAALCSLGLSCQLIDNGLLVSTYLL